MLPYKLLLTHLSLQHRWQTGPYQLHRGFIIGMLHAVAICSMRSEHLQAHQTDLIQPTEVALKRRNTSLQTWKGLHRLYSPPRHGSVPVEQLQQQLRCAYFHWILSP